MSQIPIIRKSAMSGLTRYQVVSLEALSRTNIDIYTSSDMFSYNWSNVETVFTTIFVSQEALICLTD